MLGFVSEMWRFLRVRKKLWLMPVIVTMVLLGVLVLAAGSSLAPFIYTLF